MIDQFLDILATICCNPEAFADERYKYGYAPESGRIKIRYGSLIDDNPELFKWINENFKSSRKANIKAIQAQFGIYWDGRDSDQSLNFNKSLHEDLVAYRVNNRTPEVVTNRVRKSYGPYKKKTAVASSVSSPKYHRVSINRMLKNKGIDALVDSICYKVNGFDNQKAKKIGLREDSSAY